MPNDQSDSGYTIYSAPRRFDVATIMVVTGAYALLFGALRLIRLPPTPLLVVAGFVTCVGIGQALLFGGRMPRLSSVFAGAAYMVGGYAFDASLRRFSPDILMMWLAIAMSGAIAGYIAGVAVGSVFLLSDMARKLIKRIRR